jgi:hypothetical protein
MSLHRAAVLREHRTHNGELSIVTSRHASASIQLVAQYFTHVIANGPHRFFYKFGRLIFC